MKPQTQKTNSSGLKNINLVHTKFSHFDVSLTITPPTLEVDMIEKIGFQGILFQ